MASGQLEHLCTNTLRTPSIDAVLCIDQAVPNWPRYALSSDDDMMEGVSSQAASLAGHRKLSNLRWIYNNNRVGIEGATQRAITADVARRFIAYGWPVLAPTIIARLALERESVFDWEDNTVLSGALIGIRSFWLSPAAVVTQHSKFEPANVLTAVKQKITRQLPTRP